MILPGNNNDAVKAFFRGRGSGQGRGKNEAMNTDTRRGKAEAEAVTLRPRRGLNISEAAWGSNELMLIKWKHKMSILSSSSLQQLRICQTDENCG